LALGFKVRLLNPFEDHQDSLTTLPTSIILLDQSDGINDINIEGEWILYDFSFRLVITLVLLHQVIDELLLLCQWHWKLWFLTFIIILLLLLFLLFTSLLLLLFSSIFFYSFFECKINLDSIIFTEISGHWDFNDRWIIFEIKKKMVQMNVNRLLSVVIGNHLILDLAYTTDGAFKNFLDEDTLLRMNNLIVTLFQFSVDVNVFDVKYCQILEYLFSLPL